MFELPRKTGVGGTSFHIRVPIFFQEIFYMTVTCQLKIKNLMDQKIMNQNYF